MKIEEALPINQKALLALEGALSLISDAFHGRSYPLRVVQDGHPQHWKASLAFGSPPSIISDVSFSRACLVNFLSKALLQHQTHPT